MDHTRSLGVIAALIFCVYSVQAITIGYGETQIEVEPITPYSPLSANTPLSDYDGILYYRYPGFTFQAYGVRDPADCVEWESSGAIDNSFQGQICLSTNFGDIEAAVVAEPITPYSPLSANTPLSDYDGILYYRYPGFTFQAYGVRDPADCVEWESSGAIDNSFQGQICLSTNFGDVESDVEVEPITPYSPLSANTPLSDYDGILYYRYPGFTFQAYGVIAPANCAWWSTSGGVPDPTVQRQICFEIEGVIPMYCGDGIIQDFLGEECEPGVDETACGGPTCYPIGHANECTCGGVTPTCDTYADWFTVTGIPGCDVNMPYQTVPGRPDLIDPNTICVRDSNGNEKFDQECDKTSPPFEIRTIGP